MNSKKKIIGFVFSIIVGLIIAFLPPPEGLTPVAMKTLGITFWAVANWAMQTQNAFITAIMMSIMFAIVGSAPFNVVFGTFAEPIWWFVMGVLGMSIALTQSGAVKRLSLNIMKFFAPTFVGQMLGVVMSGFVINPLVPSVAAKMSISIPITVATSRAMGYKNQSIGMHGMFLANVIGVMMISVLFINGNLFGVMAFSFLPAEVSSQIGWGTWFINMLPWVAIVVVASILFVIWKYNPKGENLLTKDYILKQIEDLGPMSRKEKITIAVFAIAILLWVTEKQHGFGTNIVAMSGFMVLMVLNVVSVDEFKKNIPWDTVMLNGTMMGMGAIMNAVGLQTYISTVAGPMLKGITGNPYIFIAVISLSLFLIRFIYSEQSSAIAIFVVLLVPFSVDAGINPWIISMVVFTSMLNWNLMHQNRLVLVAYSLAGGEDTVAYKGITMLSHVYVVICILAYWACIPIWRMTGMVM